MSKKAVTIPVHKDLAEQSIALCGPGSIGRTVRHSFFLFEEDLRDPETFADIVLLLSDETVVKSPEMPQSVLFFESEIVLLESVKAKMPKFRFSSIVRVAIERYFKKVKLGEIEPETRRNSLSDAFVDGSYRKEILISWEQARLILSRYGTSSLAATVRAAVDFVAESYEAMTPWSEVSEVSNDDRIFFSPESKAGLSNVKYATTLKANFYQQTQVDMDLLQEDYGMTFNETVRFCLHLFLTVEGWQNRVIKRDSHFSGIRLSKEEGSKTMSFMLDVDIEAALQKISPNGKIQPPARAAIDEYLATSPYANKLEKDPTWSPGRPEAVGILSHKVAVHVVASKFDRLTIAATWEHIPRTRLLDRILQDYLKNPVNAQKTPA